MLRKNTVERLTTLVKHLSGLSPKVFDLQSWYEAISDTHCGTTACAVGHACTIPEFQKLGFFMTYREYSYAVEMKQPLTDFPNIKIGNPHGDNGVQPYYKPLEPLNLYDRSLVLWHHGTIPPGTGYVLASWDAVCAFFELTDTQADWLFLQETYEATGHAADLDGVISRICSFIDHHAVEHTEENSRQLLEHHRILKCLEDYNYAS